MEPHHTSTCDHVAREMIIIMVNWASASPHDITTSGSSEGRLWPKWPKSKARTGGVWRNLVFCDKKALQVGHLVATEKVKSSTHACNNISGSSNKIILQWVQVEGWEVYDRINKPQRSWSRLLSTICPTHISMAAELQAYTLEHGQSWCIDVSTVTKYQVPSWQYVLCADLCNFGVIYTDLHSHHKLVAVNMKLLQ